jgi:hypothetical protein
MRQTGMAVRVMLRGAKPPQRSPGYRHAAQIINYNQYVELSQ